MKFLLVTMGGRIDKAFTSLGPFQFCPKRGPISAAFTNLCAMSTNLSHVDELDYYKIGRQGARSIDNNRFSRLVHLIKAQQVNYDRILVTMPSRYIHKISRDLSQHFITGVTCPIVLTGAEAPTRGDYLANARLNLRRAAFSHWNARPEIYCVEGNIFKPTNYGRATYIRAHDLCTRPRRPHAWEMLVKAPIPESLQSPLA